MKFRLLNKWYANFFYYFWLPCDGCGQMFGGHETHGIKAILKDGKTWCVCPDCEKNSKIKNYYDSPEYKELLKRQGELYENNHS